MKIVLFSGISGSLTIGSSSLELSFRFEDGARLQGRFKIHRFVPLGGLGHYGAAGCGAAFSSDGENTQCVSTFKAQHAAFQLAAERRVQGKLTLTALQIPKDVIQPGAVPGIAVVDLQMEGDGMDREQAPVDKVDGQLRRASADDPLRGQKRDLQTHHGRQRNQQHDERQQNRRGEHIGPQPADIAGPEEPGTADKQQITDQMQNRHYEIRGAGTDEKSS